MTAPQAEGTGETEATGHDQGRGLLYWPSRLIHLKLDGLSLTCLAVAVGLALRIWEYFEFRALYLDEVSLLLNIRGRDIFDFHQILEQDQMAPPGFLVVERLLVRLPLDVKASGRLFPLLCGMASVLLMPAAAKRYLDRWAVPLAVCLLALGDHLLYYSAEIKQYSCDLVLAIAALILAAPRPPQEVSPARLCSLALFGLVAPWFSFPVVFVLAGVGLHLIAGPAFRKDWKKAGRYAAVCGGWFVSFLVCFLLSRSILSRRDFIWVWWDFAFLPVPPRSLEQLQHLAETVANVFINPGSVMTPLSLPQTAILACVLAISGSIALGRRWPGGLFLLASPIAFALLASGLHQYPFHGRLLLFLVPSYLLLLAEGVAALGRRSHWTVTLALACFLAYGQASEIFWHKFVVPRSRTFDTHGDLKNDLLDYLEYARRPRKSPRPPTP